MIQLPPRIKAAFARLKKQNAKYIEIKHIKNYYFVYQSTSRWDKEKKKPIKVPLYIGRIANSGEFLPTKHRKPRIVNPQPVSSLLIEPPALDAGQKTLEPIASELKKYKHEPKLLSALSMNGKISMSVLGKIVGLKETAVASQVRKLEDRYKIKYMAEIDASKLKYNRFIITVNFLDQVPKTDELKKIFLEEPLIQLVLVTKGDFNLLIYVLAENSKDITTLVFRLRTKVNYRAFWNASPTFEDYGYIPLREEFVDFIKDKLLKREYAVLKELIKKGDTEFVEIDRMYGFDKGRSQYSYYKLRENGVIKRITISMQNLPIKYMAVVFEDIVDLKLFSAHRERILKDIISDSTTQINKYLLVDDTSNPAGLVSYLPVFKDGDLESAIDHIEPANSGINIRTCIVTSVLMGDFCYRSFDNAYSLQEELLVKNYKKAALAKIDYEETGRIKKERMRYGDIRGMKPEFG